MQYYILQNKVVYAIVVPSKGKGETQMNDFRKKMLYEGGNMGCCKPYFSADRMYALTVKDGEIERMWRGGWAVNAEEFSNFDEDLYEGDCADCPLFNFIFKNRY